MYVHGHQYTRSFFPSRISEYIPCRPAVPRQVGGVERAMMDYQQQTAKIANVLLQEFRELYGEDLKEGRMGGSQAAVNDRYRLARACTVYNEYS